MRTIMIGVVLTSILAAPAGAQDLPVEYRTPVCANDLLGALVESDANPTIPVYGMGYAMAFWGCAPLPGPAVSRILDALRDDTNTIHRFAEELGSINWYLRWATCNAWLAIYRNEYDWVLSQYGSGAIGSLPTPADRAVDCERWIGDPPATSAETLRGPAGQPSRGGR